MSFIIPNIFVSGEKANAEDVNLNFNYLKEGLESVNSNLESKITSTKIELEADIAEVKNTSDSVSTTVFERDTIVDLGEITTLNGEIELSADRFHKAAIKANSTLVFPTLEDDTKFVNLFFEFTLDTDCSLTIPESVTWAKGDAPDIIADGTVKNRLIFDTATAGKTWIGYFVKDGN